jgi:eukaryotic-like serine/threonine-protein kinase
LLMGTDSGVRYAYPGYLLFRREGTLMAQRFDAGRLELAGEPQAIAEQVGFDAVTRQSCFSVSETGVLAYHSGASGKTQLDWVDRAGRRIGVAGPRGDYGDLQLSPDDKSVAFHQVDNGTLNIWVMGVRSGLGSRLTFGLGDFVPIWSPDGSRIVFSSLRDGRPNLYQKASTGGGNEEPLLKSAMPKFPSAWSSDGRFIVYEVADPNTRLDLWVLPVAGDQKPFPFLQTPANEYRASLSPNGRWMAYVSDEMGRSEVYVRPFPPAGGKWQVSTDGGNQPRWRGDGKELFYLASDRILMAVDVRTDAATFESGTPRALFETRLGIEDTDGDSYAVTADGQRFLLNSLVEEANYSPITVVLDWTAALPRK